MQRKDGDGKGRRRGVSIGLATAAVLGIMILQSWKVTGGIEATSIALGIEPATAAERTKSGKAAKDSAEVKAAKDEAASLSALKAVKTYDQARWHPIHFKPMIDSATDAQCLSCHKEVLETKVRAQSPAGVKAADAVAWYQTLDTYSGDQATFHQRHMSTPFAKQVMNLKCNFCHQGNDPREEASGSSATTTAAATGPHDLRKQNSTASTCLLCHGKFPAENMGLEGKWPELREGMESAEAPNGCLTCHAEQFRTVRHQVSYLNDGAIEAAAKESSDTCFGCHGGRQWYRISYPYPRHPWPGMDASSTPDWAKDRPAVSDPRYALPAK